MSLLELRREYNRTALLESEVDPDPIRQFAKWFDEARAADLIEPNAMVLATVDDTGLPNARVVLLKGVGPEGFVFYTNYEGGKSRELAARPSAALCFYWDALERQVRVRGTVEKVSRAQSEAYFRTRPRASQLGAWASNQTSVIAGREVLEARLAELSREFEGKEIPLPDFWGGYCVVPIEIEFWQGRPNRLHDRLRYQRSGDVWRLERLSP